MKKLFIIAIMAVCGVMTSNAQSAEYRNEVEKLLLQTTPLQSFTDLIYESMKTTMGDQIPQDKLLPMCEELSENLYPDMIEAGIKAYYEIFTIDEIKELKAFYNTPLGKKLVTNTPRITSITSSQLMTPEAQAKMLPILMKYLQ